MPKTAKQTLYVCSNCGEEFIQWQGKCTNCGEWNTLKEFSVASPSSRSGSYAGTAETVMPIRMTDVAGQQATRVSSGFSEIDRVLGGGIVPGSVLLLGGDPGIGKSTLLLQVVQRMSLAQGKGVLYVSGEESPEQIRLRAERIGAVAEGISLLAATDVMAIAATVERTLPSLVVIDSIQTMYDPSFPSTPGSIVQVRESALRIQQLAKRLSIPVVFVGHITKEGTIAGPRTLEHLVDVVLYLEGEPEHDLRLLRAVKNRFGDATEVGIFSMQEGGMTEVGNPGLFLLAERVVAPGSVLTAVLEGSRPMLIEVQALTTPTAFGYPRRTASGFDLNRLNLLLAVLQKRAGINLSNQDVFINIVGGLKVKDPAVDAAICVALASALTDRVVGDRFCVVGEIGLSGEVRRPQQAERREREVAGLGYKMLSSSKELKGLLHTAIGL